jgi:hypothetical protein
MSIIMRAVRLITAVAVGTSGLLLTTPATAEAAGWRFSMINVANPTDGRSVLAGSTGNALAFGFVSGGPGRTLIQGQIPGPSRGTPWTAPQSSDPAQPGFVRVSGNGCTSTALDSIQNPSPGVWFINAVVDCPANATIGIFYGVASATSKVTAPSRAAEQPFVATVQPPGASSPSTIGVSLVKVTAGKAKAISIQTRQAVTLVGTQSPPKQPVIIQAVDALGNRDLTWNGTVTMTYTSSRFVEGGDLPASFTLTKGLATTALYFPLNGRFPYGPAQTRMVARSADGTLTGVALVRIHRERPNPSVAASISPTGAITVGEVTIPPNTPLTVESSSISVDGTQNIAVVPVSDPTSAPILISSGTLVLSNGSTSAVGPTVNTGAQIVVTGCVPLGTPPTCPASSNFAPVVVVQPSTPTTVVSPLAYIVNVTSGVLNPT